MTNEQNEPCRDQKYVLLVDTNICIEYYNENENEDENKKLIQFFEHDKRYYVMDEVMNEIFIRVSKYAKDPRKKFTLSRTKENSYDFIHKNIKEPRKKFTLSTKHCEFTDNVKSIEQRSRGFDDKRIKRWVRKIKKMYDDINTDDAMIEQRKRWILVKEGIDPKEPYDVGIIKNQTGKMDFSILSRAAYLLEKDKNKGVTVLFLTFDHDFITFSDRIYDDLHVHILSGWWYFKKDRSEEGCEKDPIDKIMTMSKEELLKEYDVLDEDGNAKRPQFMR